MSAIGGKADINQGVAECPLIAKSGHWHTLAVGAEGASDVQAFFCVWSDLQYRYDRKVVGRLMMRKLLIAVGVCFAVTVGSSSVALTDFEDGKAAYQRGDYATALKEFRPLAEQGDTKAQLLLGLMYFEGRVVAQDFVRANMWFNIGMANGDENARMGRDMVEKHMTATDISRAKKLAREWKAKHQK